MRTETDSTLQETLSEPAGLQSVQLASGEPADHQCAGAPRHPRLVLHLDHTGLGWGDVDLQQDGQHPALPEPLSGARPPGRQPPVPAPLLSQVA